MGKWTPNYTDDVLHAKISNLVSGSIRRAAVEKEPSISYENFVADLETGDSFTASLVDILVKELADRRTRTSDNDRKLVGERTIRGLRNLANNSHCFSRRFSHIQPRRRPEYIPGFPQPEMELDEDDDEFEEPTIEGARMNTDLYDAYAPSVWPPSSSRAAPDEWSAIPRRASPVHMARPWNPAVTITRQASIRRPRSRVVDFHEYAHRRRSNVREALAGAGAGAGATPESVTEPREGLSSGTVRRFFPFPRPRRYASASSANPWPELPDTFSPDSDDAGPMAQYFLDHGSGTWYTQHDPLRVSPEPENREEMESLLRAPRLRMRTAPEGVPSRHVSPVFTPPVHEPLAESSTATSIAAENVSITAASSAQRRDEVPPALPTDEAVAYPTPGSTENENTT